MAGEDRAGKKDALAHPDQSGCHSVRPVLSDRNTIVKMHTCLGSHSFLGKMDHKSAGGRGRGDGDNQLQLGYTEHVHTMSLHRYEELSTKLSAHENDTVPFTGRRLGQNSSSALAFPQ